jgi:hypothetical protein
VEGLVGDEYLTGRDCASEASRSNVDIETCGNNFSAPGHSNERSGDGPSPERVRKNFYAIGQSNPLRLVSDMALRPVIPAVGVGRRDAGPTLGPRSD